MTDIELLPSSVAAFVEALKGERGSLDAWLEVNNEREVAAHVEAYARAVAEHNVKEWDAEIEALRAEVEHMTAGMNAALTKVIEFRNARHEAESRAERLAEALRPLANLDLRPDGFDKRPDDQTIYARDRTTITVGDVRRAQAALRDHDQEGGNP